MHRRQVFDGDIVNGQVTSPIFDTNNAPSGEIKYHCEEKDGLLIIHSVTVTFGMPMVLREGENLNVEIEKTADEPDASGPPSLWERIVRRADK